VDFTLSGEQEMLRALVERFGTERHGPGARARDSASARGYGDSNWALLAETGLLALAMPDEFGGLGGGPVEISTVMQEWGRFLIAEPFLEEIIIAARLLEHAGSSAQQQAWLPKIAAGSVHIAFAHAEHGTRFALGGGSTRAVDGALHGGKTFVPGAADLYIVLAQAEDSPALFLVEANAPGVRRREYRLVDGAVASEVYFEAAPAAAMPGGMRELDEVALTARMAACAEMIGLMRLIFETTLDYVRQRKQFGAPIGSFQAIQHRLADTYASLELARSHLFRCVVAHGGERAAAVAAAKSYISTAAIKLGEECIQFHGGMGVSDDVIVGHAHKRILVLSQMFGDAGGEMLRYNRALAAGV
jgi:alkylation response protein AidB-like acyl-CoA dehydrogenase